MPIENNVKIIRQKISTSADNFGYDPEKIIIVCVTKNRTLREIYQVLDSGINNIGENRVQEAEKKYLEVKNYAEKQNIPLNFHMVGHLQTNKINKALEVFSLIHSIDSLRLAEKINETLKIKKKTADVLIEVNTSGEESKYGVSRESVIPLLKDISKFSNICTRGLMAMAPISKDREESRPYFRALRQLRDEINQINEPLFRQRIKMDYLSMGMSQDYEIAVQEGANMLRIGTAIFEGVL